jgi:hypothetical protein
MKNYYTAINLENNQFVGFVYNKDTNQQLYKTHPHSTQLKVVQEINNFIQNKTTTTDPVVPPQITNTIIPVALPSGVASTSGRRCCGR